MMHRWLGISSAQVQPSIHQIITHRMMCFFVSSDVLIMTSRDVIQSVLQYVPTCHQNSQRPTDGSSSLQPLHHGPSPMRNGCPAHLTGSTSSRYVIHSVPQVTTTFLQDSSTNSSAPLLHLGSAPVIHSG